jgi:hypothetical protein
MFITDASGKRSWGLVVFGVVWTAFSSIFVGVGLWSVGKTFSAGNWDRVPCVIERFEIAADPAKDPPFQADLVFHYQVEGRDYTGTRLWPEKKGEDQYEDLAEIRESLGQGPEGPLDSLKGMAAECWVNPADPGDAALKTGGKGQVLFGLLFAGFGGLFMLIGIGMIGGGLSGKSVKTSRSDAGKGEAPGCVIIVFFLMFGLSGLGLFCGLMLPKAFEWLAMRGWQETPATVIWSRVVEKDGDDGSTYAVDLFYRYTFEGREFRSNRYSLIGGSSSGSAAKREVVRGHPPGSALTVFVDPKQPRRAIVRRDPGWWGLFFLFPLPFMAVGFGGLWWYFKKRNQGVSVSGSRPRGGQAVAARARHQPAPAVAGEWIEVGGKRWVAFIVLVVFALFWNGIISFGVRDAWSGLSNNSGIGRLFGGGLGLFMIPFVLVGIGLVIAALYSFAAVFAPRYELKIGEGRLEPGKSVAVHWRRAGGRGQPRDFTLLLVGREEATYSQGSSDSTAKSVFHERVLFETTVPLAMDQGRVDLSIPGDAVPTFHGKHNRIRWLLYLRATVPRLPDLKDEREIVVATPEPGKLP